MRVIIVFFILWSIILGTTNALSYILTITLQETQEANSESELMHILPANYSVFYENHLLNIKENFLKFCKIRHHYVYSKVENYSVVRKFLSQSF